MYFVTMLVVQLGFWLAWLLIPLIYEFIPALFGFVTLRHASKKLRASHELKKWPQISLIIPVYNSEKTLFNCIRSVANSSYPLERITIIVANNSSSDHSFAEYQRAREKFKQLYIQWLDTDHGKARALNSAIYSSSGKYIIHIDSDGMLQRDALKNMVYSFETNPSIDAQTGTILTQRNQIKATKGHWLKFLRENEYYEYAQSFLAGREIETNLNHLFTMSGAFSAFRRQSLLGTDLYNTRTVGEDIEMTFQIRYRLRGKVVLCPQALFYVEPMDNLDKLYTQRQRWQRGELEVIHSYMDKKQLSIRHFFSNFIVRRLILDHTILFLRLLWLIVFIILMPLGYSSKVLVLSFAILYVLYILICLLNFINIQLYLRGFPQERRFYLSKAYIIFSLPLYYLLCSLIQFIGTINALTEPAQWKVATFSKEKADVKHIIKNDFGRIFRRHVK